MVGRRSHRVPVLIHPNLRPAISVQSIHELGHKSCRMARSQQLVQAGRQHPHLLPVHWSMRHTLLPPVVAVYLAFPILLYAPATSETGSSWVPSPHIILSVAILPTCHPQRNGVKESCRHPLNPCPPLTPPKNGSTWSRPNTPRPNASATNPTLTTTTGTA